MMHGQSRISRSRGRGRVAEGVRERRNQRFERERTGQRPLFSSRSTGYPAQAATPFDLDLSFDLGRPGMAAAAR